MEFNLKSPSKDCCKTPFFRGCSKGARFEEPKERLGDWTCESVDDGSLMGDKEDGTFATTPPKQKWAAVLVPVLVPHVDVVSNLSDLKQISRGAKILLTLRTHLVELHKGEVSFPGGMAEQSDRDLLETALRETQEEIGLVSTDVRVLTELAELPTIKSGLWVKPYVGIADQQLQMKPNAEEIAEILLVPLAHLLDPKNVHHELLERYGQRLRMPVYNFEGHRIWGLTGFILEQFLRRL